MKTLIIAEKPDMGRHIAAAIEPKAVNKRTYLEGERYIVTWAIGHLIGLAEPDRYDSKYKKWNFHDLPIIPERFKLVPHARTKDQLKVIAELAKRCSVLVNACDAGREGQLIFSYIQEHLRLKHPVKRLWISDLTKETIRRGFDNLKDGTEYENLTKAARSRSEADWLIGMNASRAFTTKHHVLLSVGRVQTPVLALVYDRQLEIEAFTPIRYFEVEAVFTQGDTVYKGVWQGERITEQAKAEALAAKVRDKPGTIAEYAAKETKEFPLKLYDLTLLQREANARYGFSAKKTLDTAQALYEKHKAISYPRTNSNYVNEQNIPEMHKALESLEGTAYGAWAAGANRSLVHKNNKYVCNPAKVEDHHAILPTHKPPGTLSADEQKIYDLVVRRFLSQFYPPAEYQVHTVVTEVERERFKTTVKELRTLGWKAIYADWHPAQSRQKQRGSGGQPDAQEGEEGAEEQLVDTAFILDAKRGVACTEAAVNRKETQPPKPYTEGTLLKAMESAGRNIEDEELREAMKEAGLGTPATRAAIIERLKQVGYVEMQGKQIRITQKGRTAVELIRGAGVELLTSPEMTGRWERRLNEIARGQASDGPFMESVKQFARLIVEKVGAQPRVHRQAFAGAEAASGKRRPAGSRRRGKAAAGSAAAGGAAAEQLAAASAGGLEVRTARAARAATATAASADAVAAGASRGRRRTDAGAFAATRPAQAVQEAASARATSRAAVAACPREGCGGYIFMGKKGYGCSHYKSGCTFVIWKRSFGKNLSVPIVRGLIEKGRTGILKLQDDEGRAYEGRIVLEDRNTGRLGVEKGT